jgi:hypothetical protein
VTVWVRKERCAVCDGTVTWNDETKELRCGCGLFKATFVNKYAFDPLHDHGTWKGDS